MARWIDEVAAIPAAPPQQQTVMVSAGHSSTDPGAVAHGCVEADIAVALRDLISDALAAQGIKHATDGRGDENLPLGQAVKLAAQADIAVEIHCNAAASSQASGVETLSHESDYPLAGALCATVADVLGIPNRGAKPENSGQHHRLAFVSDGGGIILETFFLTSKRDLASYLAGRRSLADELARVIASAARQPGGKAAS
ncbi:N-acetylmuramoyl-L-alanine amidase [Halomonas sp. B23F22_10]|uniref:N-acetylmuramoyl-L-alanine amidase n=1 Tax=Halomonas sp. B23F22_10 TaxID=3459515 RepID=UPI00373E713E